MITVGFKNHRALRFIRDRRGNFGVMTAIVLPVMVAGGGVAVDTTSMVLYHSQLQELTDAGSLAAAAALAGGSGPASDEEIAKAKQLAIDFTSVQMGNYLSEAAASAIRASTRVTINPNMSGPTPAYIVEVSASYDMPLNGMTRVLTFYSTDKDQNWDTVSLAATSTTKSARQQPSDSASLAGANQGSPDPTKRTNKTKTDNALSMYFVLDRSGSMDELTDTCQTVTDETCTRYYTKMEALKIAASRMTAQLNKADPNSTYVRTGAVSFNDQTQVPSPLAWGTRDVTTYVKALWSSGSTNSSGAFMAAYTALAHADPNNQGPTEEDLHKAKTPQATLTKTIVFMTDGYNNILNADAATKDYCDKARADGIKVYTIALMAPPGGQALLKYCASTSSDYFNAQDAADLVEAFQSIGAAATGTGIDPRTGRPPLRPGSALLTE